MALKLALIGGGRMGQAMLKGWVNNDIDLVVSLFDPFIAPEIENIFSGKSWEINPQKHDDFDIVILAIKPQSFDELASNGLLKIVHENCLLISIMAGINIQKLMNKSGVKKICRAMPNTPGQIGAGATGFFANENLNKNDIDNVEKLLSPLGYVAKLNEECAIDSVTALSGSGPAYVFLMAEAMAKAGVKLGLNEVLAHNLAIETIYGAALLMKNREDVPENLRAAVTSKGGTTFAALEVLMANNGLEDLMLNAMKAAHKRSIELGS